jgi:hypothetical protein
MKGIVFTGCSFTHGHGLWAYGDFSGKRQDDNINDDKINAFEKFTQSQRFPRLVANHFNSWEFVRKDYSGDDENSIGILNHIFQIESPIKYLEQVKFDFDDISHVIFQTSYIDRCPYIYNQETKERKRLDHIDEKYVVNTLLEWGFDNVEDYYKALKLQWYNEIKKIFLLLESKGIKCYIISITNDYLNFIENDLYMKDKLIKITYENKIFNTIIDLFNYDEKLMIINDTDVLETPPTDLHPSLKCHKILSKSIIEKIEKNG